VDGRAVFITTATYRRYPYFSNPVLAELFILDLHFATRLKEIEIYGYTVMPDHVHFLFRPTEEVTYSEVVGSIKRNVARDINCLLADRPFIRNLLEGDDSNRRLRGNFETTMLQSTKLSYAGHEQHFRRLESLRRLLKHSADGKIPRFRWQKSFRDHIIRNEGDFHKHLNYIQSNAVKHGLANEPEDWKWMWVLGMDEPIL